MRRQLLCRFTRCDYRMYLEFHEVAPVSHPLIEQVAIVRFHELITTREAFIHPARYVDQARRSHAAAITESPVHRHGILVLEVFHHHVQGFCHTTLSVRIPALRTHLPIGAKIRDRDFHSWVREQLPGACVLDSRPYYIGETSRATQSHISVSVHIVHDQHRCSKSGRCGARFRGSNRSSNYRPPLRVTLGLLCSTIDRSALPRKVFRPHYGGSGRTCRNRQGLW